MEQKTKSPGQAGRPRNPEGRKVVSAGHVIVRLDNGDWVPEHRKIVEELLGRSLLPNEKVKHKDLDKTNNSPENLTVWILWNTLSFTVNGLPVRNTEPLP